MKKILFPLVFCALMTTAQAQKSSLLVTTDRDTVALTDYFMLTVTMQNCDANSFKMPEAIDENFTLAGRPTTQTSMSFVNGAMSSSAAYTYYLIPKKTGKIEIEGISVTTNDRKTVKADKIKIVVVKEGKGNTKAKTPKMQPKTQPHIEMFPNFPPQNNTENDPFSRKPKRKTIQI
jgi:BatD DUF11 like domain